MPLTPDNSYEPAAQSLPPPETVVPDGSRPRLTFWNSRVVRICLALFMFEIGLFLIVFPWTDGWDLNYIQGLLPGLQNVWDVPYFRGALNGLGCLNVYLSVLEVIRLLRRS